jgi:hypothetical protein
MKFCPKCNERAADDLLIVCTNCGTPFNQATTLTALTSEQENSLLKRLTRKVAFFIFGGFSILTVIAVLQLVGTYQAGIDQLKTLLIARIDEEFKDPRITNTVRTVAETQSKQVIRDEIEPQVKKFKDETDGKIASYEKYLDSLRHQYAADYEALSNELQKLKERSRIMELGDQAIVNGDRKAYDELRTLMHDADVNKAAIAGAILFQVKAFYISGTRLGSYKLVIHKFSLAEVSPFKVPDESKYETGDLIKELACADDWRARARSAQLLANRRFKTVPESLLNCIKSDSNLDVVRNAVEAFGRLTGFHSPDIFEYEPNDSWWAEHGAEFSNRLQNLQ